MRQLLFTEQKVSYDFYDCDSYIFIESEYKKNIKWIVITYQYQNEYIKTTLDKIILSPFNLAYKQVEDIEHFIDGYMSYIALFFLLEKTQFSKYLPFKIYIPCLLSQGDCCDYHILQYLYTPLKLMVNMLNKNIVYYYLNTVTYFIETYKHVFHIGAPINPSLINDLSLVMMNAMIKTKSCAYCQNKYKNGLIKCLICQREYLLTINSITCNHCYQQYNLCQHNNITDMVEEIHLLKDKIEDLTQQLSEISKIHESKPEKKKKKLKKYQGIPI